MLSCLPPLTFSPTRPPAYTAIVDAMGKLDTNSAGNREAVLGLSTSTFISNSSGLIGNNVTQFRMPVAYTIALQTMSEFLLNNKVQCGIQ